MARENVRVVFQMVTDLLPCRILEPGFEFPEHLIAIELIRRTRVIVRERDVCCLAGLDGQRDTNNFRFHVVEAGRLGVECGEVSSPDRLMPAIERLPVEHGLVLALVRDRFGRGISGIPVELPQQRPEFVTTVYLTQSVDVRVPGPELVHVAREVEVLPDRREFLRQAKLLDILPEAFADLTLDVVGVFDDVVGTRILVEPLRRRLRADTRHPRDVIGAVADQGQVIDDLLGINVELLLDAVAIEDLSGHRVDERHVVADQLRHVFVDGRDEHPEIRLRTPAGQGADDVVRLDALDAQQWQSHRPDSIDERLDLVAQIVRHRWAIGLVLRIHLVAECLARRVENDGDTFRRLLAHELVDHRQHAMESASGFARRVAEFRQRVVGAIQIRRAVDQYQIGVRHGSTALVRFFLVFRFLVRGWQRLADLAGITGQVKRPGLAAARDKRDAGECGY